MNLSTLLLRRRMMMAIAKRYRINWYPIIQGSITAQDMINEYGDLFQTYDDAPDMFDNTRQKTSAFALDKSLTSAKFGGNTEPYCIVYEEGQAPIRIDISVRTLTFTSNQTYKHVVCYNGNLGGNQGLGGVQWIINEYVGLQNNTGINSAVKYWHIPYESLASINKGTPTVIPTPRGYDNSVFYIPDWWSGEFKNMRFVKCSKLRLSKGTTLLNAIYLWGTSASEVPNLTDIYVHWGLGEVPQQPGNRYIGRWKLHIPDLGNEEDNTALVAEYRSKGWNYVSGLGIFNDVEVTEPQEQLE